MFTIYFLDGTELEIENIGYKIQNGVFYTEVHDGTSYMIPLSSIKYIEEEQNP